MGSFVDSLDQVYPVVDGSPVEERYVFLVWLPDVEACLHQLSAAFEDAIPAKVKMTHGFRSILTIVLLHTRYSIQFRYNNRLWVLYRNTELDPQTSNSSWKNRNKP